MKYMWKITIVRSSPSKICKTQLDILHRIRDTIHEWTRTRQDGATVSNSCALWMLDRERPANTSKIEKSYLPKQLCVLPLRKVIQYFHICVSNILMKIISQVTRCLCGSNYVKVDTYGMTHDATKFSYAFSFSGFSRQQ